MPKIEIEVDQILTSAVAIEEIEPGDRLMVMNGVVIGVVDRTAVRAPPRSVATPPVATPPAASLDERIVALIQAHQGSLTAREIGRLLANGGGPLRVRDTLVRMRNRGLIHPTSKRRYPSYTTVQPRG